MLTGIYDPQANKLTLMRHVVALPIAGTPIRPDGKGFLATGDWRETSAANWLGRIVRNLVFIDWEGWQYLIDTKESSLVAAVVNYVIPYWDGPVAVASWPNNTLRIDTEERIGRLIKNATPHVLYTFPNGLTMRLIEDQAKRLKPADKRPDKRPGNDVAVPLVEEVTDIFRIELHSPPARQPQVLTSTVHRGCFLYPAPNQHLVAIGCGSQILVIDDEGNLVANVSR